MRVRQIGSNFPKGRGKNEKKCETIFLPFFGGSLTTPPVKPVLGIRTAGRAGSILIPSSVAPSDSCCCHCFLANLVL